MTAVPKFGFALLQTELEQMDSYWKARNYHAEGIDRDETLFPESLSMLSCTPMFVRKL